jgi:hypothetical protein
MSTVGQVSNNRPSRNPNPDIIPIASLPNIELRRRPDGIPRWGIPMGACGVRQAGKPKSSRCLAWRKRHSPSAFSAKQKDQAENPMVSRVDSAKHRTQAAKPTAFRPAHSYRRQHDWGFRSLVCIASYGRRVSQRSFRRESPVIQYLCNEDFLLNRPLLPTRRSPRPFRRVTKKHPRALGT